jgi:two-component system cell cycle sensor histidine kinase PleC
MKQMLINLLSNAVKFTSEGGDIKIAARQLNSQDVELSVCDNGIGMSPENIPTALSVFGQIDSSLTRKYEGTGLGLPLVKALIESHGGHMNIDSALGRGTTVSLIIPKRRVDCAMPAVQ